MNTRIRKAGHRLLLDPSIRFWYYPRGDLGSLYRQIFTVGRVKAWILGKHYDIFKVKYVLPSVFVLAMLAALAGAAVFFAGGPRLWGLGALAVLGPYVVVVLGFALGRVGRLGLGALRLVPILPTLHVGYGAGFLLGALEIVRRRRNASAGS
jgi:hypothetical protein